MNEEAKRTRRRTAALVIVFIVSASAITWALLLLAGFDGVKVPMVALLVAADAAGLAWLAADRVVVRFSRARVADEVTYARLHNIVDGLCIAGGLPKPSIRLIVDDAPNAMAAGRSHRHATLAVTTGLLERLDRLELEAVVAHELCRIKNNDVQVATLAVCLLGPLALLSDMLIRLAWWNGGRHGHQERQDGAARPIALLGFALLVFAPVVSRMMHLAVSRSTEIEADAAAVAMTRYPPGLISALEKMSGEPTVVHAAGRSTAHLWLAAPLAVTDEQGRLAQWNVMYDTHPPLEHRIEALREL